MPIHPKISCIIPFYNEGQRVNNVLNVVTQIRNLSEIICVDDASATDKSAEIKQLYPKITLVRLETNLGKTGAIREGLRYATGEYVLLLDADLRNLAREEIEKAIDAVRQSNDIDMLILRRVKAPFFVKLTRGDVIVTGERILKKIDLQEILQSSIKGWQLEVAINRYMHRLKKNVFWMPHSGINMHRKGKWRDDIKHHQKTLADIISAAGLFSLIGLILFFAKKEIKQK
ncbi:MAG: glycosyltransferase family 2 protein [Patescibacteria group bacterium]